MSGPLSIGTTYEVVNARRTVVQQFSGFDARKRATAFAKANGDRLGDLTVEEVIVTVSRRRVYRPRPVVPPAGEGARA